MAQTNPARLPDFRSVPGRNPYQLLEDLKPATAIANAQTNKVLVPILGARVIRIRALVTGAAGTLKARYVRPTDHATEYTSGQPADVPLVAGTEVTMDIITCAGEHYLSVQILSAGALVVSYVDVAQLGTS
jgi:hypothetical protein